MKRRSLIIGVLTLLCLAMVWATWSKGRELADLREKQKDLLGQLAGGSEAPTVSMTAEPPEDSNTPELLQLRAEVSRLARRKQEVGSVLAENRRLKTQLASISTNTQTTLPPGYIRKSAARNVGYATPQAALETFLWAMRNNDMTNFLEAFTAEAASQIQKSLRESGRDPMTFFSGSDAMPGVGIVRSEPIAPNRIRVYLEFVPGIEPQPMHLKVVNGEWKLMLPL